MSADDLEERALSYDSAGATAVSEPTWESAAGFRRFEHTELVRSDDAEWDRLCAALLDWAVKTRSGFVVRSASGPTRRAREGATYEIEARLLGGLVRVYEPARVVDVVHERDRCGFAYGTLLGHPVSGEEAFVLHRNSSGIWFTLRSITRPAPSGFWRWMFPFLLVAQRVYRAKYLRAFLLPEK